MSIHTKATLSRETVLAVKSVQDATTLLNRVGRAYRAYSLVGRARTVDAAYATNLAIRVGIIGTKASPGTESIRDYAEKRYGVSHSLVMLWRRLGVALVDCQVDPESDMFALLAFQGAMANRKPFSEYLDSGSPTPEGLAKVIQTWQDTKAREAAEGTRQRASQAAAEKETKADAEAVANATPLQKAKAAILVLKSCVGDLSTEDWSAVESALQAIVTKEVTIRTRNAERAAKAAATKAAAAAKPAKATKAA